MEVVLKDKPIEESAGLGSAEPGRQSTVMALSPLLPSRLLWMVGPVGLTGLCSLQRRRWGCTELWWFGVPTPTCWKKSVFCPVKI